MEIKILKIIKKDEAGRVQNFKTANGLPVL
jgi:hypothetical protein